MALGCCLLLIPHAPKPAKSWKAPTAKEPAHTHANTSMFAHAMAWMLPLHTTATRWGVVAHLEELSTALRFPEVHATSTLYSSRPSFPDSVRLSRDNRNALTARRCPQHRRLRRPGRAASAPPHHTYRRFSASRSLTAPRMLQCERRMLVIADALPRESTQTHCRQIWGDAVVAHSPWLISAKRF